MTQEQQRQALAKAFPNKLQEKQHLWFWTHKHPIWITCLANDPLRDLNLMFELEKSLDWKQMGEYCTRLDEMDDNSHGIHTTAAHRAKALIATLKLEP